MTSLTTDDFPYTIGYVKELLNLEEPELMDYVRTLDISPRRDDRTGKQVFTHHDIEVLRKAQEMHRQGDDLGTISQRLTRRDSATSVPQSMATHPASSASQALRQSTVSNKENLAVMVEAVSQVKEGILKDLSRLLDDKLSGLDEVVVELIRCKSENDTLKQKLEEAREQQQRLEYELSRFKQVQFGFYRKM